VSQQGEDTSEAALAPPEDAEQALHDLYQSYKGVNQRNVLESYHDAQTSIDTVMTLFNTGYVSLEQRCLAENIYFALCHRIWQITGTIDFVPEELGTSRQTVVGQLFLQLFVVPVVSRIRGPSSSCFRSCRFISWTADRLGMPF
jgi:arginine decarboxylase-like protein